MSMLLNFLMFQIGWFACVLGAANDLALTGSFLAIAVIALHLYAVDNRSQETRIIVIAMFIGLVFESAMVYGGLAIYTTGMVNESLTPYWMVLMWALFAMTANHSMSWFKRQNAVLVSLAGAVFAPLAYFAGYRLGAVQYPDIAVALTTISLAWAVLFPVVIAISRSGPQTKLGFSTILKKETSHVQS